MLSLLRLILDSKFVTMSWKFLLLCWKEVNILHLLLKKIEVAIFRQDIQLYLNFGSGSGLDRILHQLLDQSVEILV